MRFKFIQFKIKCLVLYTYDSTLSTKNLALITIAIALFSCKTPQETQPVVQDIKELVFASGTLQWKNSYNLTAQTDGVLSNISFEVGNKVSKGKILAKIDNSANLVNTETSKEQLAISKENLTDNSPALQQLQQNINFAETKYKQDKTQAERYLRLFNSQSVAKVEYENYQLAAENSLSNWNALKKQYGVLQQQAKQNYITTQSQLKNNVVSQRYNSVVVPQNGTVIKKLKTNGDYVRKGDVIATVADADNIELELNVDESSIGKIKVGQTVFVKLNTNEGKTYNAKINEIVVAFDDKSQSFICKATFDESVSTALYGTQLEANIFIGEKKNALLIPRNLMGYGNKVNVKGKDQNVIVKTGIVSSEYVEVLEGITKNDILLPLKP